MFWNLIYPGTDQSSSLPHAGMSFSLEWKLVAFWDKVLLCSTGWPRKNIFCSLGRPQTHGDPPTSASSTGVRGVIPFWQYKNKLQKQSALCTQKAGNERRLTVRTHRWCLLLSVHKEALLGKKKKSTVQFSKH